VEASTLIRQSAYSGEASLPVTDYGRLRGLYDVGAQRIFPSHSSTAWGMGILLRRNVKLREGALS
jgi:hypothetical protein